MMSARVFWLCIAVVVAAVGCEHRDQTPARPTAGFGKVHVVLTDAPAAVDAVNVCIERVDLVFADSRPTGTIDVSRTVDLLELQNGVTTSLGIAEFPVGLIQQVRLILCPDGASVIIDGVEVPVKVPSGEQTGIKLLHPGGFEISENTTTLIVLDFDAEKSIHQAGSKWMLTPVVQLVEKAIVLAVTDPSPGDFVQPTLTVRGTVASKEPLASLTVNGAEATVDGLDWSAEITLAEGPAVINVEATDALGRVAVVDIEITADETPPHIDFISPANNAFFYQEVVPVEIQLSDNLSPILGATIRVVIDGTDVTANLVVSPDLISGSVELTQGSHTITVEASDCVGNHGVTTVGFSVDLVAATLEELEEVNGAAGFHHELHDQGGLRYLGGTDIAPGCVAHAPLDEANATALVYCFFDATKPLHVVGSDEPGTDLIEVVGIHPVGGSSAIIEARQFAGEFAVKGAHLKLFVHNDRVAQFTGFVFPSSAIPPLSPEMYQVDPGVAQAQAELLVGEELMPVWREFDPAQIAVVQELAIAANPGRHILINERTMLLAGEKDVAFRYALPEPGLDWGELESFYGSVPEKSVVHETYTIDNFDQPVPAGRAASLVRANEVSASFPDVGCDTYMDHFAMYGNGQPVVAAGHAVSYDEHYPVVPIALDGTRALPAFHKNTACGDATALTSHTDASHQLMMSNVYYWAAELGRFAESDAARFNSWIPFTHRQPWRLIVTDASLGPGATGVSVPRFLSDDDYLAQLYVDVGYEPVHQGGGLPIPIIGFLEYETFLPQENANNFSVLAHEYGHILHFLYGLFIPADFETKAVAEGFAEHNVERFRLANWRTGDWPSTTDLDYEWSFRAHESKVTNGEHLPIWTHRLDTEHLFFAHDSPSCAGEDRQEHACGAIIPTVYWELAWNHCRLAYGSCDTNQQILTTSQYADNPEAMANLAFTFAIANITDVTSVGVEDFFDFVQAGYHIFSGADEDELYRVRSVLGHHCLGWEGCDPEDHYWPDSPLPARFTRIARPEISWDGQTVWPDGEWFVRLGGEPEDPVEFSSGVDTSPLVSDMYEPGQSWRPGVFARLDSPDEQLVMPTVDIPVSSVYNFRAAYRVDTPVEDGLQLGIDGTYAFLEVPENAVLGEWGWTSAHTTLLAEGDHNIVWGFNVVPIDVEAMRIERLAKHDLRGIAGAVIHGTEIVEMKAAGGDTSLSQALVYGRIEAGNLRFYDNANQVFVLDAMWTDVAAVSTRSYLLGSVEGQATYQREAVVVELDADGYNLGESLGSDMPNYYGERLNSISAWEDSQRYVWAVGERGAIFHRSHTGSQWVRENSGTWEHLNGVWAASSTLAWAVGNNGTILRRNVDGTWNQIASGTSSDLHNIAGVSGSLWAVGDWGTALTEDGAGGWIQTPTPTSQHLTAVAPVSTVEAWAVGRQGVRLKWDGTQWTTLQRQTSAHLFDVWASASAPSVGVWAVGEDGTIINWNDSPEECVPKNCWEIGLGCGVFEDGCGWFVNCGACQRATVAADGSHTCAVAADRSVYCWGANTAGQLGNGLAGPDAGSLLPVQVLTAPGTPLSGAVDVAAGKAFSCALRDDGQVFCWGWNSAGQLGIGIPPEVAQHSPYATAVFGLWDGAGLGAGGTHVCAVIADGTVWCWGDNTDGQLGANTFEDYSSVPVRVHELDEVSAISMGVSAGGFLSLEHSCALKADGTVWCWGNNGYGQLGDGTTESSPVPVQGLGIHDATTISAGGAHTCAIREGGNVSCWGWNLDGQLGFATEGTGYSAVPVTVPGLTGITLLAAGSAHTCAAHGGSIVFCWGNNAFGQLGRSAPNSEPLPMQFVFSGLTSLSAGVLHSCAADETAIRCWGDNANGRLGDGTENPSTFPVVVTGIDP